jgi:hypothetical protein
LDRPKFVERPARDIRSWCEVDEVARDLMQYMEFYRDNVLNSVAIAVRANKPHEAALAAGALDCITGLLAISKYAQDEEPAKDAEPDDFIDSALIP